MRAHLWDAAVGIALIGKCRYCGCEKRFYTGDIKKAVIEYEFSFPDGHPRHTDKPMDREPSCDMVNPSTRTAPRRGTIGS